MCTRQSITYLLAGYFFVLFALTVVAIFVTGWASLAAVAKIERQSGGTNSGGSITQTLTNKNGGGVTLDKTVTTTSADGKSITIQRDANGDNLNDQTESRVTAADGSATITVSDLNPDGSLKDQTTSVTTANGLTRMTQSDLDGNSTTDVTVTDATVVNADASRTQTVSQTSNNGMLANKTVTRHSADGSTKSVKTDVNGDGTFDLTQAFVIAFAADRSSTTTEIDTNADGSLRSKSVVDIIVRFGKAARLEGQFPLEVQSLVDERNELLNARDEMIRRARARAGDLAHGLKTPLAILAAEARRLKAQGRADASEEITRQVDLMNRDVERQLARTRARGPGEPLRAPAKLEPAIQRLVKTLKRPPQGERLNWVVEIPDDLEIDFDQMDFDEVAGNILDNARKWARTRVTVTTSKAANELQIVFEDDGPGVAKEELPNVIERGGRLAPQTPGTGLGLAIVTDVLEIYNGKMQIENAMPSGLRVSLLLPHSI